MYVILSHKEVKIMSEKDTNNEFETMAVMNAMNQTANSELGITQEYNKKNREKLWDSTDGKTKYREKVFGDKQVYKDPISGEILHKNQGAAQKKYHMKDSDGNNISKKWAHHSAETDHVTALKDGHDVAKHNPFLTDNDFKEIMNSEENYRILSKSDNTSKGEKSDWEIIRDKNSNISIKGKAHMAKEKIRSDVTLQRKFTARTAKNVGKEFTTGAKDALEASAIPLVAEAVSEMIHVAQGEESLKEAGKKVGKTAAKVAVVGGADKLIVDVASTKLANSKSEFLQKIGNSNEIGKIVAVALIVKDSAIKYIDGEIDEKEFVEEVGVKGATMVAAMIGGEVGREIGGLIGMTLGTAVLPVVGTISGEKVGEVIGEVLGAIITSVACSAIVSVYQTYKHLNDYKRKESQIRRLESDALKEISHQRQVFKDIFEREYHHWDKEIQSGFDMIVVGACKETFDLQKVTGGLDKILAIFGKSVAFKNLDEYEAQLDSTLELNF